MKILIKILPIILSFAILCSQFSIISYASSSGVHPDPDKPLGNILFEGAKNAVFYLISQLGALTDGNFFNFLQNKATWDDYWNGDNVSVNDDGTVIFSDKLVAYIKQALKEYAAETCGFWVIPTKRADLIGAVNFKYGSAYNTLKNITKEKDLCIIRSYNYFSELDIGAIFDVKEPYAFVCTSSQYDYLTSSATNVCPVYIYGADTWVRSEQLKWCRVRFNEDSKAYSDFESFKSASGGLGNFNSDFYINYNGSYSSTSYFLCSKDGRNVRVFKSLNAFKYYDTGTRSVYFGSGFYEDTGSVSGSYDDLKDWLDGKYDDFFDRFKDLIPDDSNLTEDDLEKLVDQILDKLGDIDDSIGDLDDTIKETNSWLQKIYGVLLDIDETVASAFSGLEFTFDTSGIEQYPAYILEDLDYITYILDDMTAEEVEDKTDSLLSDLVSAFSEVGEVASRKFPLSIPWDVYTMLTFLGGERASPASYGTVSAVYSSENGIVLYDYDDHGGSGGNRGDGDNPSGGGHSRDPAEAPVFEIPFVISESQGLNGTIDIDLSGFDVLSSISHTMFTLIFCYNLIGLTFKVITLGKELIE